MNRRSAPGLALAMILGLSAPLLAQAPFDDGLHNGAAPTFRNATTPSLLFAPAREDIPQQVTRKSPLVAGLLSYVLPGVGSYYAGNTGHGHRHLLIAGGLVAILFVASGSAEDYDEPSSEGSPLLAGWALAFVGNSVWSIVTAVQDAKASNRAAVASIPFLDGVDVEPTVRVFLSPALEPRLEARVALTRRQF